MYAAAQNKGPRPKRLRIAQVAPLFESVPPRLYGGTERVVSALTEELCRRGHEVTLFASGDSVTQAKLRPGWPESLRLAGLTPLGPACQLPMLREVYERAGEFDVIHTHLDYWNFPLSRLVLTPTVTTLHGRLDIPELLPIYSRFRDAPVISISNAQRRPLPFMNWIATVYHGLPSHHLRVSSEPGKYLAFLGRISPEKRPDLAIQIALRSGVPIKLAAKVDAADRSYYEAKIKPLLSASRLVEFIGEIGDQEKSDFLGNALALLFPIDWPEPFGLVMIEALACGTPVIARPCGSVPEVLRDGVTAIIRSELDELVAAVSEVGALSHLACRKEYEERFSAEAMAERYEQVYEIVIAAARFEQASQRLRRIYVE